MTRFKGKPAIDPATNLLVKDGSGQVYAVTDTAFASPLEVTDTAGLPLATISTGPLGIHQDFDTVADHLEVVWKSGPYTVTLESSEGIAAAAAASAAQPAADAATATAVASLRSEFVALTDARQMVADELAADPTIEAAATTAVQDAAAGLDILTPETMPKATAFAPLNVPTYDGNPSAGHPDVVRVPGGWNGYEYWMAFTPFPTGDRENPSIVASHDGINWVVPAGLTNPVHPPATAVSMGYDYWADTDMVLSPDGTTMLLFFKGTKTGVSNHYVRSTSTDGITWTAPAVVVTDAGVSPSIIVEPGGTLTMIEVGDHLQKRTSTDLGATWSAVTAGTRPTFSAPYNLWHADVTKADGVYHALVTGSTTTGTVPYRLFHWTSPDGLAWSGSGSTPDVPITGGRLDRWGHYRSCLIPAASGSAGKFDLWLTMMDDTLDNHDSSIWRIGHIRDFDFSDGEKWVFPAPPEATLVAETDERVILASEITAGTGAVRGQVPTGFGGAPAIGMSGTAASSVLASFAPLPAAWSHFTIEALLVHDDATGGDVALWSRIAHKAPGEVLDTGIFRAPPAFGGFTQKVAKWVDVTDFPGVAPRPVVQGGVTTVELQRQFGQAADTLPGSVWVLAIRLRRVRRHIP